MKKSLLIIFAVAILGVLAVFELPHTPPGHNLATRAVPSSAASQTSPAASQAGQSSASSSAAPAANSTYHDGTYTGSNQQDAYGDVQVMVTISGGKISQISFKQFSAYDSYSRAVNNAAAPQLKQQTLSAQSAQIDGVSGATYTSDSYISSLQSALDKALAG